MFFKKAATFGYWGRSYDLETGAIAALHRAASNNNAFRNCGTCYTSIMSLWATSFPESMSTRGVKQKVSILKWSLSHGTHTYAHPNGSTSKQGAKKITLLSLKGFKEMKKARCKIEETKVKKRKVAASDKLYLPPFTQALVFCYST
ncbi:hypothetical protein CPB85DRAFT_1264241 [Mucidula mucida]|nr:hypothetical protein CPB85DRAFT_1264241 [Mucidula mucida]